MDNNQIKVKDALSLNQADPPPAAPAAAPPAPAAKASNAPNVSNASNGTKSILDYMASVNNLNWYEDDGTHTPDHLKDDTPFHIKSHPVYKKLAARFMAGNFRDKDLETWKKQTAKNTIQTDEIDEEKEREGMYPNELDAEMQNYKYGDRL